MQNHLLQIVLYCVCISSGISCRITCCRLYCIVSVYLQGYHAESPAADCIVLCVSSGISCRITCCRLYCIVSVYLQGYHAESPAADCIVSCVCIFRDIMQNHLLQIVLYCVCVSSGTSYRITCCRLYCILCVYLQGYHAESPAADCMLQIVLYCVCVYLQGYHAESHAADCIV